MASSASARRPTRRSVLGGIGAAALGSGLVACSAQDPSEAGAEEFSADFSRVLPTYVASAPITPDIPGRNGSTPGYLTYPRTLPRTVPTPPGSGSSFTLMAPAWTAIQANPRNDYTRAIDDALGSHLEYQMTTGDDYRDKQSAVFASPKNVADWVSVFGWNPPARFDQAAEAVFEDLTPFLAGDRISAWPNLANLPSASWQFGIFSGRLYGIPVPGEIVTDAVFYREDLFAAAGVDVPRTVEEFRDACRELTDERANRWALNDTTVGVPNLMFNVPPDWRLTDAGDLEYRWETDEYRDSLVFQRELFSKGYVHPDARADSGDAKQRFESGQVAIHYDGVGAWAQTRKTLAETDPSISIAPLPTMAPEGQRPIRYAGSPTNFFSFFKKSEDKDRIRELIGIANLLAAPYGTAEWELVTFGKEGVHFTRDAHGVPQPTEALEKQNPGVLSTLVTGPVARFDPSDPDFVRASCDWMAGETDHMIKGPFYGYQVVRPTQYAALDQPLYDLEKDVVRGRASMDDVDEAVTTWKKTGGDRMREYYRGVLEQIRS